MSSTPQIETEADVIRSVAAELLKGEVAALERIGGGRNSRVFRVEASKSRSYAMKLYYRHDTDARDRLGAVGGELASASVAGDGTRVTGSVPMR